MKAISFRSLVAFSSACLNRHGFNRHVFAFSVDICRVCRAEGTQENPLYHPCICTGSIKFIHQDWYVVIYAQSKLKFLLPEQNRDDMISQR